MVANWSQSAETHKNSKFEFTANLARLVFLHSHLLATGEPWQILSSTKSHTSEKSEKSEKCCWVSRLATQFMISAPQLIPVVFLTWVLMAHYSSNLSWHSLTWLTLPIGSNVVFATQTSTCHKLSTVHVTVKASKLATEYAILEVLLGHHCWGSPCQKP